MKKKKSSMQTTWWFDPVYCCNFWIVAGCSTVELKDYISSNISSHTAQAMTKRVGWDDDGVTGRTVNVLLNKQDDGRDAHGFVIWNKNPFTAALEDYVTLSHEAVHAAEAQLGGRGLYLNADTSEAYAYYVEHIVRNAAAGLLKQPKKG